MLGELLGPAPLRPRRGEPAEREHRNIGRRDGVDLVPRPPHLRQRRILPGGRRRTFDARVTRVADGDTIEAVPAGESRPVRMRLEGVDAPELGEPFAREAQGWLRTLLQDARVRVTGRAVDSYGRLVARVEADGQDASTALVRAGLACHAYARDAALAREESQARAAGAGFWASTAAKPQCVERTAFSARDTPPRRDAPATGRGGSPSGARRDGATSRAPANTAPSFRGNTASGLYHAPSCPNYNCRNCTRLFASEAEARAAGFKPAGDCLKR